MKPSLSVAVFMGGPSEEHEVSLRSGQGAAAALRERGFRVEPVVLPRAVAVETAREAAQRAIRHLAPDVVFIALHGTFGEDGTIQQLCEALRVAYTGSDAAASRVGMDKIASRQRFVLAGLSVPRWRAATSAHLEPVELEGLHYPLVVKPSDQGSSVGVSLVGQPDGLSEALQEARRYSPTVLVEECIKGRELTVSVIGEQALPVVEIMPKRAFFDFTAKYTVGMTDYQVPAALEPDVARLVQEAGRRAHAAVGCRHFSRTDLILTETQVPVVLEVNTIPGLTPTSLLPKAAACLGMSYGALCEELVMMACPPTKWAKARKSNAFGVGAWDGSPSVSRQS